MKAQIKVIFELCSLLCFKTIDIPFLYQYLFNADLFPTCRWTDMSTILWQCQVQENIS